MSQSTDRIFPTPPEFPCASLQPVLSPKPWQPLLSMSVPTFYLFYFLGCAGSSLLLGFSLVGVSKGYSVAAVRGLLSAEVSLVVEHGLWGARASVVVTWFHF